MAKEEEIAGLTPEQSFAQAGQLIIMSRFTTMWAYREATLSGDEEALHDMRVGSRRLRAALDVFAVAFRGSEYQRLHSLTARLTDELGKVRDHDVMLLGLQRYRKGVARQERPGIDDLITILGAERYSAQGGLRRFFSLLNKKSYAPRMTQLFTIAPEASNELAEGSTDG